MSNINRLPTKLETTVGATVAFLISLGLGWVLWFVLKAIAAGRIAADTLVAAALLMLALIFAWCSALFFRILFGKPGVPSFRAQKAIGWFMVAGGTLLALISFPLWLKEQSFVPLGRALTALTVGLAWVYQARKRDAA